MLKKKVHIEDTQLLDVESIIKEKPSWIIRNGLLGFLILAVGLIVGLNFVRFVENVEIPLLAIDEMETFQLGETDSIVSTIYSGEIYTKGRLLFIKNKVKKTIDTISFNKSGYLYLLNGNNKEQFIVNYPDGIIRLKARIRKELSKRIDSKMLVAFNNEIVTNKDNKSNYACTGKIVSIKKTNNLELTDYVIEPVNANSSICNTMLIQAICLQRCKMEIQLKDKTLFKTLFERIKINKGLMLP